MNEIIEKLTKPLELKDIKLRVGSNYENGFSLLLNKTARADVKRLNEVFGLDWNNSFYYDNNGLLVAEISVYDGNKWITRRDVGTESNMEKEKGLYSDAFKRAGFKFGIGAELYEAPHIFIRWEMEASSYGNKSSYKAKNFYPNDLKITKYFYNKEVGALEIEISYKGNVVFSNYKEKLTAEQVKEIESILKELNIEKNKFLTFFKLKNIEDLNYTNAITALNKKRLQLSKEKENESENN